MPSLLVILGTEDETDVYLNGSPVMLVDWGFDLQKLPYSQHGVDHFHD